MGMT